MGLSAGLAGNTVTGTVPVDDAAGAAVQFEMLTTAGFDIDSAVAGLAAFSLFEVDALLALPILTVPAMLGGVRAHPGLVHAAFVGLAGFALAALRRRHPPHRLARRNSPLTGLDARLLANATRSDLSSTGNGDHPTAHQRPLRSIPQEPREPPGGSLSETIR